MDQHSPEYWKKLYEPYELKQHSKTYYKQRYKPRQHSRLYYQNRYIYGGRTIREQLDGERKNRITPGEKLGRMIYSTMALILLVLMFIYRVTAT